MFADLHGTLQRLVHEQGRVPPEDVDVRFEAPRRDWVDSLVRPTLDFFLFDVRENLELRQTNLQSTRENGRAVYRVPTRRFDLRYMVSALTTDAVDEHLLLWRALLTLLKYAELPAAVLPEPLRALDPPIITQVKNPDDETTLLDVWSGLETRPRPALLYVVTVPVDLDITIEAPLVLTRTARYARSLAAEPSESRVHIGGVVRDRRGNALAGATVTVEGSAAPGSVTDEVGQFVLPNVPPGAVTLVVDRAGNPTTRKRVEIPSDSYEVVVD